MFPSQFQNDDIFQQLLVFLKNKDQEIGKSLKSQTADLCINLSRVLTSPKRFSSEIVYTVSCFYWMYATFDMNQHIFRKFPWPFLVQNILF